MNLQSRPHEDLIIGNLSAKSIQLRQLLLAFCLYTRVQNLVRIQTLVGGLTIFRFSCILMAPFIESYGNDQMKLISSLCSCIRHHRYKCSKRGANQHYGVRTFQRFQLSTCKIFVDMHQVLGKQLRIPSPILLEAVEFIF